MTSAIDVSWELSHRTEGLFVLEKMGLTTLEFGPIATDQVDRFIEERKAIITASIAREAERQTAELLKLEIPV